MFAVALLSVTNMQAQLLSTITQASGQGQSTDLHALAEKLKKQDAKAAEYKQLIKQIKKQTGAKKVTVEMTDDGYWFFLTSGKRYGNVIKGAVDSTGNVMVSLQEGFNTLDCLPSLPEGYSEVKPFQQGITPFKLYHPAVKRTFWVTNYLGSKFYDTTGKLVAECAKKGSGRFYPGYVVVGRYYKGPEEGTAFENRLTSPSLSSSSTLTFMTSDGKVILDDIKYFTIEEGQYCIYTKEIDGISKQGAISLTDPTFSIPCLFAGIDRNEWSNKWKVKKNANDKYEEYDPSGSYEISYRDEGEKLFDKRDYDGVIEFYKNEGLDAPWASYFTAYSLQQKADNSCIKKRVLISMAEEGNWFMGNVHAENALEISMKTTQDMLKTSRQLYEYYLASEDSTYKNQSKSQLERVNEMLKDLSNMQPAFNNAIAKWQAHNAAVAQQQLEAQKQQEAVMSAVFGIFTNSLSGGRTNNATRQSSTVGTTASTASSGVSTTASSSGEDNTNRKIFLKNQITDWKNKLKKAEAARNQALEHYNKEKTGQAKRLLDSKENTVNECLNMISQYESELKSLK